MPEPEPASLMDALADAFAGSPALVEAFGHDEEHGPHKFWRDLVQGGDEAAGVAVPPPYVVAQVLGSGAAGLTFARGYTEPVTVLLKTFAGSAAEAERLGKLAEATLLGPSLSRTRLAWEGGAEVTSTPGDGRTMVIPGRGGPGGQLHGRYKRFTVTVAGQY